MEARVRSRKDAKNTAWWPGRGEEVVRDEGGGGDPEEEKDPCSDAALVVGLGFVFGQPSAGEQSHGWQRGEEVELLAGGKAEEDEDCEDPEAAEEARLVAAIRLR
jgi:hypothetical protein